MASTYTINFCIHLLFLIVILLFGSHGKLIAVTKSAFVLDLYKRISNEEAPESDHANGDARFRESICEEITSSEYFSRQGLLPVDMKSIPKELCMSESGLFRRIYATSSTTGSDDPATSEIYEYTNSFELQTFNLEEYDGESVLTFREHVFACLLRAKFDNNKIYTFYVSKGYNVVGNPYKIGRFIFADPRTTRHQKYAVLLLAEEPAEAHSETNFKVEIEYLLRREGRQEAESEDLDPVCRLVSDDDEPANQLDRLCAVVLTSSYFRTEMKIEYPRAEWFRFGDCSRIRISFKTTEAIEKSGSKIYYERAVSCLVPITISETEIQYRNFYISRAYESQEVFVYEWDSSNKVLYLVNLTRSVGIVHEP